MANLARYQAELERLKASKTKALTRMKSKTEKVAHTVMSAGTAYVVGAADAKGANPLPDLFGIDKKLVWGIVSHGIATQVSGRMGDAFAAIGDGLVISYAYTEGAGKGYTIQGGPYSYQDVGAQQDYVVDDIEV